MSFLETCAYCSITKHHTDMWILTCGSAQHRSAGGSSVPASLKEVTARAEKVCMTDAGAAHSCMMLSLAFASLHGPVALVGCVQRCRRVQKWEGMLCVSASAPRLRNSRCLATSPPQTLAILPPASLAMIFQGPLLPPVPPEVVWSHASYILIPRAPRGLRISAVLFVMQLGGPLKNLCEMRRGGGASCVGPHERSSTRAGGAASSPSEDWEDAFRHAGFSAV